MQKLFQYIVNHIISYYLHKMSYGTYLYHNSFLYFSFPFLSLFNINVLCFILCLYN